MPSSIAWIAILLLTFQPTTARPPAEDDFECDPGFWFDNEMDVCNRNMCQCPNGSPVHTDACPKHKMNVCLTCNDLYYLDDYDTCQLLSSLPQEEEVARKSVPKVVCRNGNFRKKNLTLVDWLETDEFLSCTDLLLSVRVGNNGDHGAKAIAAALIRAGAQSNLQNLVMTGGAITDDGAEWLAAAIGGPVPEYEDEVRASSLACWYLCATCSSDPPVERGCDWIGLGGRSNGLFFFIVLFFH